MTKYKKSSFIKNSLIFNIISVAIIVILSILIYWMINYKMEKSFPIINDVLDYEEELEAGEYSKIPLKNFKNSAILVYNDSNKTLYSSNKEVEEKLSANDIKFINEYYSGKYYIVYDFIKKEDNQKEYYIMQIENDGETENIIDYTVLNSNLEVIYGNLFGDLKKISQFQFYLINGMYEDYTIEKYQYEDINGEPRTLVFIAPDFNITNYEKALKEANRLWFLLFPVVLIVFLVEMILYKKRLEKCLEPLRNIIKSYERKDKTIKDDNENIVIEFEPITNKFNQLLEQIDKNELDKNEMIANISHDLKTPLTAIEGYAQAFKDRIVPEEKKEKYINAIYEKSILTTDLINRLFEYTKLEHPEYKVGFEDIDINSFSREYLAKKYSEIEIKDFILDVHIPENKCICNIDKELFTRLYDNIISNSLKYNSKGTKILFEIKEQKEKVKIKIADNGIGIQDDLKEKIFDPFTTSNKSRTSGKGTGLGMAIVKKIVDLHGGKIELNEKSSKEYKTEFIIEIKKIN